MIKLLILLLNNLPIFILSKNINIQGSFFPSGKDQKFFKYYFTKSMTGMIELLENISIVPYTSISVIALDTKLLHEKQSELIELNKRVSEICSHIDWEVDGFQEIESPQIKSNLSTQFKLATLFTAGSHFERKGSKWKKFMDDFRSGNTDLMKLKEQLEIYIPKKSIKAYDIEFSNFEFYFEFRGNLQSSTRKQKRIFKGSLDLSVFIPCSQEIFEETKRGLFVVLESLKNRPNQEADKILKATELEARIRDQECNRASYFKFDFNRPIEIEKTADSSGSPMYKITFEELDVNRLDKYQMEPGFHFANRLLFEGKYEYNVFTVVYFGAIGLWRKHDIEDINSLLDGFFETPRPDTINPGPDTTKSKAGKGTLVVLLALFLCLGIAIFSLGYYYRKKVKNCSGRVYKKQQGRKKLKLGK